MLDDFELEKKERQYFDLILIHLYKRETGLDSGKKL